MDAEGLKELFEPFGQVTVKRMFGGAGVYTEGLCFAIESKSEVFLRAEIGFRNCQNQRAFGPKQSPPVHPEFKCFV
jgi:TfoX/Sxy family transcriptional regulator of competence genes